MIGNDFDLFESLMQNEILVFATPVDLQKDGSFPYNQIESWWMDINQME